MRTGQINFSIPVNLQERIETLIPKGERSKIVCKLLTEHCDKLESEQVKNKSKKIIIEKYYKPFIRKYAGTRDPFYLFEDEGLRTAFKKEKITISEDEIIFCINEILIEGEA